MQTGAQPELRETKNGEAGVLSKAHNNTMHYEGGAFYRGAKGEQRASLCGKGQPRGRRRPRTPHHIATLHEEEKHTAVAGWEARLFFLLSSYAPQCKGENQIYTWSAALAAEARQGDAGRTIEAKAPEKKRNGA